MDIRLEPPGPVEKGADGKAGILFERLLQHRLVEGQTFVCRVTCHGLATESSDEMYLAEEDAIGEETEPGAPSECHVSLGFELQVFEAISGGEAYGDQMVGTEGDVQEVAGFLGQIDRTSQQRRRRLQRARPRADVVADHGVHLPAIAREVFALHQREAEFAEAKAVVMMAEAGPDR